MPIMVKDYTWTQSAKSVTIRVPLSPVNHEKVDLFPTDSYIKAHYRPFLLELFLLHHVNIKKSSCIVQDDMIVLDLEKREEVEWDSLERDLTKTEKMKVRQEILDKCQEEAKQNSEDKQIKKSQLDRFTVQRAMEIETIQHNVMDSRRDFERKKAMDELEEWRVGKGKHVAERSINGINNPGVIIEELPPDDENNRNDKGLETVSVKQIKTMSKKVSAPKQPIKTPVRSEYVDNKKEEVAKRVLPKLRQTGEVEITHTPRTFPTPSRESTADEEQTWLKNITQARRATGFVSEDLRPEEQDPQWCKEKGDEFFRSGNFLGAISAYTHGITLSDKLPSLYANRSAVHFVLGNFNKCMNDCSTALDLMKPACESNRRSRAKCIARRAAALARVGYLSKAIDEMKAAAKLVPDDEQMKQDIFNMERAWEQNPDSD